MVDRCATFGLGPPTISAIAPRANQPHHELDAFRTRLPDTFDVRHLREALGSSIRRSRNTRSLELMAHAAGAQICTLSLDPWNNS